MKFLNQQETMEFDPSGTLFEQVPKSSKVSPKALQGFTKVLVNGRVVGVDKSKSFQDRMIGDGMIHSTIESQPYSTIALLEIVTANLEAGMKLLDKQELSLAKIGGKLSDIALSLNQAREYADKQDEAQCRFSQAREVVRKLVKTTFDHTVLFANGPSKPIVVAVPTFGAWEGFSIDRCDISTPGFRSIELGKVIPQVSGLLLDPSSVRRSFREWRKLCMQNRLQWHLLSDRLRHITHSLMSRAHDGKWTTPPFPEHSPDGPLRRPHRNN